MRTLIFIYSGRIYSIDENGNHKEEENNLNFLFTVFEKIQKNSDTTFVITKEEKSLLKDFFLKGAIKSVYWHIFFEDVIDSKDFDFENKVTIQKMLYK
jgi:hypothetical protein